MPMRVIAKKRCRAMFEPPEKGERATLNPNLSTRLRPAFFSDQALGRRVAITARGGERCCLAVWEALIPPRSRSVARRAADLTRRANH
jgi:hypothetical protein